MAQCTRQPGGAAGWTRTLLICGALSSLLYVAIDVVGAVSYPGYSAPSQAISEMSAIGAPTAGLLAPLYTLYSVLFALFGAGVWLAGTSARWLRWSAAFIIAVAALGIGWALFPMNPRAAERSLTDTMHLVLSGVTMLLLTGAIVSGAAAFGRGFRIYSAATVVVMLLFGALTAGRTTPERGAANAVAGLERTHQHGGMAPRDCLSVADVAVPGAAALAAGRSMRVVVFSTKPYDRSSSIGRTPVDTSCSIWNRG